MPAPKAAPTLPSTLYKATGTPVAFTKAWVNTGLKNKLACPALITEGSKLFSLIISSPYLKAKAIPSCAALYICAALCLFKSMPSI